MNRLVGTFVVLCSAVLLATGFGGHVAIASGSTVVEGTISGWPQNGAVFEFDAQGALAL
jgi:hypothetical protein